MNEDLENQLLRSLEVWNQRLRSLQLQSFSPSRALFLGAPGFEARGPGRSAEKGTSWGTAVPESDMKHR